ncbi:MAG: DUF4156 domain-containing protein [Bdellovibrionia bacterium]
MKRFLILALLLSACASRSLTPDSEDVKMSREIPSESCKELGRVTGTSKSRKATHDELLADMRQDAAKKSANYVKVEEYSSLGTSVTGTAFSCP